MRGKPQIMIFRVRVETLSLHGPGTLGTTSGAGHTTSSWATTWAGLARSWRSFPTSWLLWGHCSPDVEISAPPKWNLGRPPTAGPAGGGWKAAPWLQEL